MWKPLEQPECYRKAGAAQSPAAALLARLGELIMTLLSSLGGLWITSPDQNLPEREDCASPVSSQLLLDTHQASAREEL